MARRQKIMIASKDTNRLKRIEFKSINCSKYDRFFCRRKQVKNRKENLTQQSHDQLQKSVHEIQYGLEQGKMYGYQLNPTILEQMKSMVQ